MSLFKNIIWSILGSLAVVFLVLGFLALPATGKEAPKDNCINFSEIMGVVVDKDNALRLDSIQTYSYYKSLRKTYLEKVEPDNPNVPLIKADKNIIVSTVFGDGYLPLVSKYVENGDKIIFLFKNKCMITRIVIAKDIYKSILTAMYRKSV